MAKKTSKRPKTTAADTIILGPRDTYHKRTDVEALKLSFANQLKYALGKDHHNATPHDRFLALALAVRDRVIENWMHTQRAYHAKDVRRVYYLSMEYLLGRLLGEALVNLGIYDEASQALKAFDLDIDEIRDCEPDAGLGSGGLGRLAACFMESMATLGLPAFGYGLRFDFGTFRQRIVNGQQVEEPDAWLRLRNPWELPRPDHVAHVQLYGRVETRRDLDGRDTRAWVDATTIIGVPYDTPIAGYKTPTVNTLRLWRATSPDEFDLEYFNSGDFIRAVERTALSENITRVLYPADRTPAGQALRLAQEYFLVSTSLQDILRRHRKAHASLDGLASKVAIHLNDTHPALAVPELMRLLIDHERFGWDDAWTQVCRIFSYTNHTILSEALERWSVDLIGRMLPRHLEIIYEINRRFLIEVRAEYPGDEDRVRRMSLIEEGPDRKVRMANLSVVASNSINGVAELHTDILRARIFNDFTDFYPGRFNAKTNGVSPRRWIRLSNPDLSALITDALGDKWVRDLTRLAGLEKLADDAAFRARWREVKRRNKKRLARLLGDPPLEWMFDCQIKRFHEYKRQHLNIFRVIDAHLRGAKLHRVVVFAGKAAPNYVMAKSIIHLIHEVAAVVKVPRVAFLPDYRVSLAQIIVPGADLSEQISTAGLEASGTGNMKFAMNGALTIGTLDGANVEIRDAVGPDNFFLFGLTAEQIEAARPAYDPRAIYESNPRLKAVIDAITAGAFGDFSPLVDQLLTRDPYFVLADFAAYLEAQERVDRLYADRDAWTRMAILNVARMGRFSSDRAVQEYARDIWKIAPVEVS